MFAPEPNTEFYSGNTIKSGEIGYPVRVCFIEMSKMYMQRIRWHWHPEIEVLTINEGEAELTTDDRKIHLKAGQSILVNQNVMHSVQLINPGKNCHLYSTTFHPSFLFGYGNTVMSGKYLSPVLNSPIMKTILLEANDPVSSVLTGLICSVISANKEKPYGYELITKSLLCQFWVLLLGKTAPQDTNAIRSTGSLSLDETRVKEAILYIENHYAEPITLGQLADSVHISKSECCRCFKRALQLTPIEYLMRYRILKAATMIQSNNPAFQSISDLAFSVGFNNVSYFNKVFKQYIKCTPSEYRKNIKIKQADAPQSDTPTLETTDNL